MKAKDLVVGADYALVDSKDSFARGLETPTRVALLSERPHIKGRYTWQRNDHAISTERFGTVTVHAPESTSGWSGAGALVAFLAADGTVARTGVVTLAKLRGEYAPVMAEFRANRARRVASEAARNDQRRTDRERSQAVIERIDAIVGTSGLSPASSGLLVVDVSVLEALLDAAEAAR